MSNASDPGGDLPLIAPDSPPGVYRGPRGGLIEITQSGGRIRLRKRPPIRVLGIPANAPLPVAAEASREDGADASSIRYHLKVQAVMALQEWAQVAASRDERVRAASAAGVGVNEIARNTGIAKTTVIRILR